MNDPIPITSIIVSDRMRRDHSDTDGLQESLKRYGTIQPIVLEATIDNEFRLVAGGRRLSALKALGHDTLYHGSTYNPTHPGYIFGVELTESQLTELELEENIRRKEMTWQEQCLSIAKTHRLRISTEGDKGGAWGQEQTGRLLKISRASVGNALWVAAQITNTPAHPIWSMSGLVEALQYKLQLEENSINAELARRDSIASFPSESQSVASAPTIAQVSESEDKLAARTRYLSNPLNDPEDFESYYSERQAAVIAPIHIPLSPRLWLGNSLEIMASKHGMFDHIITDPPYAIDMDNLDQQNLGVSNIASVRETHKVDENLALLQAFVPAAYLSLKANGFLIMWCDQEVWDWLKDQAQGAGFKAQRWPITWVKLHQCANGQAAYNFTKTTEIAMVCRKGNVQIVERGTPSHILAAHDDFKTKMDHPFVKPYAAWEHLIQAVSIKGQSIYDPFMGEGSGVISALRMGRNYFGSELDPIHYHKALEHVKGEYLQRDQNIVFS